jgi:hypothetical protein
VAVALRYFRCAMPVAGSQRTSHREQSGHSAEDGTASGESRKGRLHGWVVLKRCRAAMSNCKWRTIH